MISPWSTWLSQQPPLHLCAAVFICLELLACLPATDCQAGVVITRDGKMWQGEVFEQGDQIVLHLPNAEVKKWSRSELTRWSTTETQAKFPGFVPFGGRPGTPSPGPASADPVPRISVGTNDVSAVAASPDGHSLLTGGLHGQAKLWDAKTRLELVTFLHGREILDVGFSPAGDRVVTAGQKAKLWSTANGRLLAELSADGHDIVSATFAPEGRQLITTGACVRVPWPGQPVSITLLESRTGVQPGQPQSAILWDVGTGQKRMELRGHTGNVLDAAFAPDAKTVATASDDGTIGIWNTSSGETMRVLKGHTGPVLNLEFSKDGGALISGSADGSAILWDPASGNAVRVLEHRCPVSRVAFSPLGGQVLTCSDHLRLWDSATGREIRQLGNASESGRAKFGCAAFTPDGAFVICGGSRQVILSIVDSLTLDDREILMAWSDNREMGPRPLPYARKLFSAQAWSRFSGPSQRAFPGPHPPPASPRIAAAPAVPPSPANPGPGLGEFGWMRPLWSLKEGTSYSQFDQDARRAMATPPPAQFQQLGTVLRKHLQLALVLLPAASAPPTIFDLAGGQPVATLGNRHVPVKELFFAADGVRALVATTTDTRVWNTHTGRQERVVPGTTGVRASPVAGMNHEILTWSGRTVTLWDLETGAEIRRFEDGAPAPNQPPNDIYDVILSPDGKRLMTVNAAWPARCVLWDSQTAKQVAILHDLHPGFRSVSFSPDGSRILAPEWNMKSAEIWDADAGTRVAVLKPDSRWPFESVDFAEGGRVKTVTFADKTVTYWDAETGTRMEGAAAAKGTKEGQPFASPREPRQAGGRTLLLSKGLAELLHADTQKTLASFVCFSDSGWVTFLPDRYYCCSRNALASIDFAAGDSVWRSEQFDAIFNRPDLVMGRLGCSDKALVQAASRAYQQRLARLGLAEQELGTDLHLPVLTVDLAAVPYATADPRLTLRYRASDSDCILDRVLVAVNGVPIGATDAAGKPAHSLRDRKTKDYQDEVTVELSSGRNRIDLSVLNQRGAESVRVPVYVECTAKRGKPDLWILAVGISNYRLSKLALRFAAKDARDIADLPSTPELRDSFRERFQNVHVLSLLDGQATREQILEGRAFFGSAHVDDTVVLFVAAHGFLADNSDYYCGTYDVDPRKPEARGLLFDDLNGLLAATPARSRLLLIDTCHAGEIDSQAKGTASPRMARALAGNQPGKVMCRSFGKPSPRGMGVAMGNAPAYRVTGLLEEFFADLRRGTGAIVIGACSGDEYSVEGQRWQNGVFTYAVLEGLRDFAADANHDGKVQVSELQNYVKRRVPELTQGGQNPTVRQENLDNDFVLVSRPARATPTSAAAAPPPAGIKQPTP